jgi:hypothetical protein
MLNRLIYVILPLLTVLSAVPPLLAEDASSSRTTQIVKSAAIPNNANTNRATYRIAMRVGGGSLSQVAIDIPDEISIGEIEVKSESGQKIESTTSVNGHVATVVFAQPISPGTAIEVNLRDVSTRWRYPKTWFFPVTGNVGGVSIPLGLARFQTYGH